MKHWIMNSHWAPIKPINQGSATVMVLIAVLILAVIGAGLVAMQKNLYSVALKVENELMQADVSDHCVQSVVKHLRTLILTNPSSTQLSSTVAQVPSGLQTHMSTAAFSGLSALSSRNQYQNVAMTNCTYRFIMQRATQGTVAGGEVNRTRSYGSTDGMEKIYEVKIITCDGNSNPCRSVKTETVVYVGVQ